MWREKSCQKLATCIATYAYKKGEGRNKVMVREGIQERKGERMIKGGKR